MQQIRSMFGRLARKSVGSKQPAVSFEIGPDGLRARLHNTEVTAEVHLAGDHAHEQLAIPLCALSDFSGRRSDLITLERSGNNIQVSWQDGVVPKTREYEEQKDLSKLPTCPRQMATNGTNFLRVLAEAVNTASQDTSRYALNHIQLRGKTGEVVGTDGQQLLVQCGYGFGWSDDVLIPASSVFACKEVQPDEPIRVGKSKTHVTMIAGAWTLHFPIATSARFPAIESVVPATASIVGSARLDSKDRDFLSRALSSLPGKDEDKSPITLALNDGVIVRAKSADDGKVTELHLAHSKTTGKPIAVSADRQYLARALAMGLHDIVLFHR